ncbi:protein kinase subdomain-containing protein PKL/ccin3 [Coprinopsis cinerea okayama7|uniref:Protein kinase subdomain-containing protein PKL/ccin3 n=1 Tax=Coprinopsis cinerea (strain Okayama-7 / 130 / ATCC MYA-4618 / FGSC 9003) TaxID=240176 RepID=A8NKW7_COPC7|nr:protein kinase subdomain-containing protein PKL/ccin3 [Coprinopsis cinerea okayama7\|eukprot:XP_001834563.2 protein kinase subdomain-containing protein PKL/ccin3 [Coprinopsis cinerea okayama7\
MFSTLLIHDCVVGDGARTTSITLRPSPSFPGAVWFQQDRAQPAPATWGPKDPSNFDGTLELSLVERISEGRIGVTYAADVVSAVTAAPEFSRSLAREAWFYEQMSSLQGISVPLYFGFFTSTAPDVAADFGFEPWMDRKVLFEDTDTIPDNIDQYPSADWLTDDVPENDDQEIYENPPSKLDSPWYKWNRDAAKPTISVLVLELLGEPCTGWKTKADKQAVKEVMDDLAELGVMHDNLTPWNTLVFKPSPHGEARLCPRHNVVHPWRIIDFDRSTMADPNNLNEYGRRMVTDTQYILDNIAVEFEFWAWQ